MGHPKREKTGFVKPPNGNPHELSHPRRHRTGIYEPEEGNPPLELDKGTILDEGV